MKRMVISLVLLLTLAGSLAADTRCEHARKTCNARANYVFETCLIVYGESQMEKCLDQADAYAATCMAGAGC